MKTRHFIGLFVFVSLGAAAARAAPLRAFATTADLADLVAQVGGAEVQAESLSRSFQDPHFVEPKPSLIAKLMRADFFVETGLELEVGWAPLLLQSARNAKILPGGPGYVDASMFVQPMEIPAQISRAGGDIHPGGNPHYMLDPENARLVARGLAEKLSAIRPAQAESFRKNLAAFEARLDVVLKEWAEALAPYKGAPFISYHRNMIYFARRYHLEPVGEIEPKPGIPPTAAHTRDLLALMRNRRVAMIITQPFFENRTPAAIARDTGAAVVSFAIGPDGNDYIGAMDANVKAVAQALKGPSSP